MNVKHYILFPTIFFITYIAYGQNLDSLKVLNFEYDSILKSDNDGHNNLFYKHQNDVQINNLGPFGSPFYFPTSRYLYNFSLFEEEDVVFEKLNDLKGIKPFTNIRYINASRKEQLIGIKHIQNLGKLLTFNFDFNKTSSPGAYQNQETNNTFFKGRINYHSKNDKYSIEFQNLLIRNFYELNGGLYNSGDFNNSIFEDERSYRVNLNNSNSYIKGYNYQLEQKMNVVNWTSNTNTESILYLKHKVSYESKKTVFFDNDPRSLIYSTVYLDSSQIMSILSLDSLTTLDDSTRYNYLNNISRNSTIDSSFTNNLSNKLSIGWKKSGNIYEVFLQKDLKSYYQGFKLDSIERSIDTNYSNDYIGSNFFLTLSKFRIRAVGVYCINGYRKSDILTEFELKRNLKNINLKIGMGYYATEPDLKQVNYISNHYSWNNNLNKQKTIDISYEMKLKKYKIELEAIVKNLTNTLYYDSLSIPTQNISSIRLTTLSLAKDYRVSNFFFRTALIYQSSTENMIVPLPDFIGRQIFYYQTRIFNKALKVQLGAGCSYSTGYYGYAYNPAISEFRVQQEKELGYYPSIDLFLNTHLKRAQIFLKYEHFNSGRSVHKSYASLNYPILPRSLKFGISWNMFD